MAKQPHNVHELMLALTRVSGGNLKAVEYRDIIAAIVVAQMIPEGCVVKGGSSLRMRLGPGKSRVTEDVDMAMKISPEIFDKVMSERLRVGWCDFTGELLVGEKREIKGVEPEYVMQPFVVKLSYRHQPLCKVKVEVSHNELGDAEEIEMCELPPRIAQIFADLNLPLPKAIPLMTIPFQIAQKLHGLTEPNSKRARDLVDLQLIAKTEEIDWSLTAAVCRRLFTYRKRHAWPPAVVEHDGWQEMYDLAASGLDNVLPLSEAIGWGNDLIGRLNRL